MPNKKKTCLARIKVGNEYLYLKSLFPIEWSHFISDAIVYSGESDARGKMSSRHFQLSNYMASHCEDMHYFTVMEIELATYVDGKIDYIVPYINAV